MRIKRRAAKGIRLKAPWELERLRTANRIVREVLERLRDLIQPDITTLDLDRIAHEYILKSGAKPAFLGYRGYPATICISINEEVVHGIPSKNRRVKEGDLVSVDIGAVYKDYV